MVMYYKMCLSVANIPTSTEVWILQSAGFCAVNISV